MYFVGVTYFEAGRGDAMQHFSWFGLARRTAGTFREGGARYRARVLCLITRAASTSANSCLSVPIRHVYVGIITIPASIESVPAAKARGWS